MPVHCTYRFHPLPSLVYIVPSSMQYSPIMLTIRHNTQSLEELPPIDQHLEKQHQEKTKVKNINVVEMGRYEMDTWWVPCCLLCYYRLPNFHITKSIWRLHAWWRLSKQSLCSS